MKYLITCILCRLPEVARSENLEFIKIQLELSGLFSDYSIINRGTLREGEFQTSECNDDSELEIHPTETLHVSIEEPGLSAFDWVQRIGVLSVKVYSYCWG